MERVKVNYQGRVQGVGFRMTTHHIARSYEVRGYVKNLPDGSVEMVAEGNRPELKRFREDLELRMGDFIKQFDEHYSEATGSFDDFSIQY